MLRWLQFTQEGEDEKWTVSENGRKYAKVSFYIFFCLSHLLWTI